MKGRPPKPTHLKLLHGEKNKNRINEREPKPALVSHIDKRPSWLSPHAKRFWRMWAPVLKRLGVFTELDTVAFILLCEAYSEWRGAKEAIAEKGSYTIKTSKGYEQQRPEVGIMHKARKDMEVLFTHFGMSPSSRTRVVADLRDEDDEFEALLD